MNRILCILLILLGGCKKTEDILETAPKPQITQFQTISMAGLTAQQQSGFIKLVNDEICPCNCPQSFAACLETFESAALIVQRENRKVAIAKVVKEFVQTKEDRKLVMRALWKGMNENILSSEELCNYRKTLRARTQ